MCIKKVISLFILLLANVAMLAHPVVRYLQYNNYSQTSVTVCPEIKTYSCCKHAAQHSSQDAKNEKKCCDKEKCLMHNLFSHNCSIKIPKPLSNNFDFNISNIPACQITQITDLTSIPFRHKPYTPLVYAGFVSQSIGLRAPPVC